MAAVDVAGRKTGRGVTFLDPHSDVGAAGSAGEPAAESERAAASGPAAVPLDARIAALADAQHGIVSLTQLRQAGLTDTAVRKRAANGRLHRIYRGVYAVGRRRLGRNGRLAAAVLACGPGAVVSHRSAANVIGLAATAWRAIEVTVPTRAGCAHPGLAIHRSSTLGARDVTQVDGIPSTTVARTLLDLADVLPPRRLLHSIEAAERLGIYDGREVAHAIDRAGGRPAATRLASMLAAFEGPPVTNSELEARAFELFMEAGLPRPRINARVGTAEGPIEVDFLWPDRHLVVEADGYTWHSARRAFEEDRRRDQLLRAAGYAVVRVTWRQVMGDRLPILRALRSPIT